MQRKVVVQAGLCLLGCLHLIAFTSLLVQYPALFGRHGIQPISSALRAANNALGTDTSTGACNRPAALIRWTKTPSLLWLHSSIGLTAEALFVLLCGIGFVLAAAAAVGFNHYLLFAALWVLYLSFDNMGGVFVEAGDDILLEVTFVSIWLAAALHTSKRRTGKWQEHQLEYLSTPSLMLLKWVLFKLLLINSTFSVSTVCASAPGLVDCYRAMVAHGLPTAFTRSLVRLPGPLAFAATILLMLELPAAFLLLFIVPSVQWAAGSLLLVLQLLRITLGPASLMNLVTAGLCVLAVNNAAWIPVLAKAAAWLRWRTDPSPDPDSKEFLLWMLETQPPPRRTGSNCSLTSMFVLPDEQVKTSDASEPPTGPWARLQAAPRAVLLAIMAAFLAAGVGYNKDGQSVVLRHAPLTQALRYCVPATIAWFLYAQLCESWRCLEKVVPQSRADAKTVAATMAAGDDIAILADVQSPPLTPRAPATEDRQQEMQAQAPGSAPPAMNGHAAGAGTSRAEEQTAVDAAAAAAGSTKGAKQAAEVQPGGGTPARNHRGGKHKGAYVEETGQEQPAQQPAQHPAQHPAPKKGTGGGKGKGQRHAKGRQAGAANEPDDSAVQAQANGAALHAVPAAATPAAPATPSTPTAAAAASVTPARQLAGASRGGEALNRRLRGLKQQNVVWAPAILAVTTALCMLAVFVVGVPAVWQAGGQRMSALEFIPGLPKAYEYARYWGVVSGTAKARAAFRASAVAAAIHPGSVLAYEVYVMNTSEVWHRVPFKTVLGPPVQASEGKSEDSSSDSNRSSGSGSDDGAWWGWLRDLRGLYEPRLQAKMAAAGARDAWDEEWLVRLTTKTVEGAPQLLSVLQQPPQPCPWATLHQVSYLPTPYEWELQPDSVREVVKPLSTSSLQFKAAEGAMQAEPGDDGWLVSRLEAMLCQVEPAVALLAVLLLVLLRHCLLRGGLLHLCAEAVAAQQRQRLAVDPSEAAGTLAAPSAAT